MLRRAWHRSRGERLIALLEAQLGSPVQVGVVQTHFDGGLRVDAEGIEAQSVLRGVPGDPARPMLRVQHLQAHVGVVGALLSGMFGSGSAAGTAAPGMQTMLAHLSGVTLDGASVRFENGDGGRAPLVFDLPRVELSGLSRGTFRYRATVDAGQPVGPVETQGTAGPWNAGDPRQTPLNGSFAFEQRNVGSVHGLRGVLSMTANYSGTLSLLAVEGTTVDPAFGLDVSAHTVDLRTQFKLRIDAAHGVVHMDSVDARFLQTHFLLNGTVTKGVAPAGYVLDMALAVPEGRVEDALVLGAPTEPPLLRGGLTMTGRLQMPAGSAAVAHKLELTDGQFRLRDVQFGKARVQRSADALSEKAKGHPQQAKAGEGAVTFGQVTGRVALQNGAMQMSGVRLEAPGMELLVGGQYLLGGGGFALRGTLHTDASASDMQTGMKHVLLKPFNGLFSHGHGGTTLPLQVTGAGNEPHFKVTMPGGATMDVLD